MSPRLPLFVLIATMLAACAPDGGKTAASGPALAPADTMAPRLPGRIVRTDGYGNIPVALPGAAACPTTSRADAAVALHAANRIRAAHGLPLLAVDPRLQRAAEAHACDMARRGTMTHAGTTGSGPRARASRHGYRARIAAENIAAGRFDLDRVLAEWSISPGHAHNVLLPQVRQTGIGHAVAADGKTAFWTVIYAAPH